MHQLGSLGRSNEKLVQLVIGKRRMQLFANPTRKGIHAPLLPLASSTVIPLCFSMTKILSPPTLVLLAVVYDTIYGRVDDSFILETVRFTKSSILVVIDTCLNES